MRTSLGTAILMFVAIISGSSIVLSSQIDAYPEESLQAAALTMEFERIPVALGGTIITVEVADTEEKSLRGLSGRSSLPRDTGMLFLFPSEDRHSFWMKDMSFPIDIIWFSSDKTIVGILPNLAPETYPKSFVSSTPDRYVLEVPAGFAREHNLSIGMSASW
ncbi:MAG: DUF192 domain-containing protein [Candidatus Yonathbacteria bacterium]|nr:DUF192 domain-containing protein [Candidatus Yonathbacteria bacterium]